MSALSVIVPAALTELTWTVSPGQLAEAVPGEALSHASTIFQVPTTLLPPHAGTLPQWSAPPAPLLPPLLLLPPHATRHAKSAIPASTKIRLTIRSSIPQ